ncbi:hypothetical protein MQA04_23565, partial [Escherichia coli]|nr:hypothetical protein [Escherichia coli]
SLKTSIKTITYLSDIGCLEIHGASLETKIHKQNRDYCANLTKEVMPDGNTECYPAHYENWFIAELSRYNFDRIF